MLLQTTVFIQQRYVNENIKISMLPSIVIPYRLDEGDFIKHADEFHNHNTNSEHSGSAKKGILFLCSASMGLTALRHCLSSFNARMSQGTMFRQTEGTGTSLKITSEKYGGERSLLIYVELVPSQW